MQLGQAADPRQVTGVIVNGLMGMRDNDANMRLKYSLNPIRFLDCHIDLGVCNE